MRQDEQRLLAEMGAVTDYWMKMMRPEAHLLPAQNRVVLEITAGRLGIHWNRVHAILIKWVGRKWWDYGVSPLSGWLTKLGLSAALNIKMEWVRIHQDGVPEAMQVMEARVP